jgi:TRAP-type C4-dicarboxylate transport system permease small subunit
MTPLAGFVAAILAAWIIREPRRAAAAIIVPFLGVLAVQTWTLAAGRGDNPPSTPQGVSYWIVQVIALAFALGIATQLAILLRARSAGGDKQDHAEHDNQGASRRALRATALLLVLAAAFVIGVVLDSHPVLHHNPNSPLPLSGVIGILALVGGLVVVTVRHLVQRRAGARQRKLAVEANPGQAVAGSRR